jgi:tRNA (mo5U34)-methyltransferase
VIPPVDPNAPVTIPVEEKRRAAAEEFWHYQHDLGDGVQTTPWWDWLNYWHGVRRQAIFERVHEYFGPSLAGLRCMDVACNSGFWSFELIDRGAESVFAFDVTEPLVASARFVRNCRPDKPEYRRIDFQIADYNDIDLPESGFDLVLALGMMYHLTDVYGVAQRLVRATGRLAIIDSSISDLPGDVLEIPPDGKYFWISKGEFSFVPTRSALRMIFEHAGFSRVTPWLPDENHPCYKEYGPNGFRHILVCEK